MASTVCPTCASPLPADAQVCPSCGSYVGSLTLLPGTTLHAGKYRIDHVLGQGGFGITYGGVQTMLELRVAIKEYFPQQAKRAGSDVVMASEAAAGQQSFLSEGRTLAKFNHPNIVRVIDVFEENRSAYIVMEYVEGTPLQQLLDQRGSLPEAEALDYIAQAGQALAAVHRAGLLHQDIKPDNLMRSPEGRIVLIDFGTAKGFQADHMGSYERVVTPGYGPLEQYGAQVRRGPFTDIYALAATLYALLTGLVPPPAPARGRGQLLEPISKRQPEVSQAVADAVTWGLTLDINKRPQHVQEFLEALGVSDLPRRIYAPTGRTTSVPLQTTTLSYPTPHLDRARELLRTITLAEHAEHDPLFHNHFYCPSCHSGLMQAIEPSDLCPLCQQAPLRLPSQGSVPCPECQQGVMEMVEDDGSLPCPLCRQADLQAVVPTADLRCPACTQAELHNHVPNRRLCAVCHHGTLERRHDSAMRCPNCLKGTPRHYSQRGLFGKRHYAHCDHCHAHWRVRYPRPPRSHKAKQRPKQREDRDSLLLDPEQFSDKQDTRQDTRQNVEQAAEQAPSELWQLQRVRGRLEPYLRVNQPPEAWELLSGRSRDGWHCPHCQAEWDKQNTRYRLMWTNQEQHPLLGRSLLPLAWAKLAHHLQPQRGTHSCPSCRAEWDIQQQQMTFLRSPQGYKEGYLGHTLPLEAWARLAAGKRSAQPGLLCYHCGAEWDDEGEQLRLVHGGHSSDPQPRYEAGATLKKQQLSFIARGKQSGKPGALCRHCSAEWDRVYSEAEETAQLFGLEPENPAEPQLRMVRGKQFVGEMHSLSVWHSKALGRKNPEPGPTCPACHAEWLAHNGQWELIQLGTTQQRPGRSLMSVADWKRLAAGKLTPGAGYKCGQCGLELSQQSGSLYRQSYPSPGETRSLEDWRYLGQGLPLLEDIPSLKDEAKAQLKTAFMHGEWRISDAQKRFPRVLQDEEAVLFVLEAHSARKHEGSYVANVTGQLWFSTRRLVFDAPEGHAFDIAYGKIRRLRYAPEQLWIERYDRWSATVLFVPNFKASHTLDGLQLETMISTAELSAMIRTLKAA